MAIVIKDRVQNLISSEGTGVISGFETLGGFQDFSVLPNGTKTYYTVQERGNWEVGIGTYSGGTLTRDSILGSSANDALIVLSGNATGFITYPADKAIYKDDNDRVGINVASPSYQLDVSGTGNFAGILSDNIIVSENSIFNNTTLTGNVVVNNGINITGDIGLTGNLTLSGNIIPTVDGTQLIGESDNAFSGVYSRSFIIGDESEYAKLQSEGEGILSIKDGGNRQEILLYKSFTDNSDYERVWFTWNGSNFVIETQSDGLGSTNNIILSVDESTKLSVKASSISTEVPLNVNGAITGDSLYLSENLTVLGNASITGETILNSGVTVNNGTITLLQSDISTEQGLSLRSLDNSISRVGLGVSNVGDGATERDLEIISDDVYIRSTGSNGGIYLDRKWIVDSENIRPVVIGVGNSSYDNSISIGIQGGLKIAPQAGVNDISFLSPTYYNGLGFPPTYADTGNWGFKVSHAANGISYNALFVAYNSPYLGIYNNSPAYQLDVSGTGNFSSGVRYPDGNIQTIAYNNSYRTVTGNYMATNNDYGIFADASETGILITLPSGSFNKEFNIIRIDASGTNMVTVTGYENINQYEFIDIVQYNSLVLIHNSTQWYIK